MQQIILLNFLLNRWLTKAYTIGLIAELTIIIVLVTAIGREVLTREKSERMKLAASVSQHTAKTVLTIKTIKVTRFRTLITPWKKTNYAESLIVHQKLLSNVSVRVYSVCTFFEKMPYVWRMEVGWGRHSWSL